jgi:hypothetical protein
MSKPLPWLGTCGRRSMIDLGLGRVLELFEERFGRNLTTILLAVIGLGVFAVCGRLVWEIIIVPVYRLAFILINLPGWKISLSIIPAIITWIVGTGLAVGLGVVINVLLTRYQRRRIAMVREDAEAALQAAEHSLVDARRVYEEISVIEHWIFDTVIETNACLEKRGVKVPEEFKNIGRDKKA